MRIIMGLFNSELYQYIFQKKFSSVKVLRSHIEELPVPAISGGQSCTLIKFADDIENGSSMEPLNDYVYNLFRLKRSEIEHIKSRVK